MSSEPLAGGGHSKRRIGGLFDEDEPASQVRSDAPTKSIEEYLRETPAEPLSRTAKAVVWAVAIVVAALLAASIYRAAVPRTHASVKSISDAN